MLLKKACFLLINATISLSLLSTKQFIETNKNIVFDFINPGEYYVRLIYDENENKRWDSGNYLKKKQPENIIYYPTKLEIRANWSLIETFNLE